jgi:hypothetical protein
VDNPVAFLEEMEQRAALVMVNLLEDEPGDQALHHHALPVRSLVDRVAELDLVSYRVLHRRSHLVVYRPRRAGVLCRALARLRVAIARRRARHA